MALEHVSRDGVGGVDLCWWGGKTDGFIRKNLLGMMKSCVCSLEINTGKENTEVCRWSRYLD